MTLREWLERVPFRPARGSRRPVSCRRHADRRRTSSFTSRRRGAPSGSAPSGSGLVVALTATQQRDLTPGCYVGPAQGHAGEQGATVGVHHGQGMAARRPHREVPCEVHAPQRIGSLDGPKARRDGGRLPAPPPRARQAVAVQDEGEGTHGRDDCGRIGAHQHLAQLPRPPAWPLAPRRDDGVLEPGADRPGTAAETPGLIHQRRPGQGPGDPLVAGLATDAEPAAPLAQAVLAPQIRVHESLAIVHG